MVFNNITIDNFRGIEHLEINGLGNANVFLGQNNGGKTTLLEAVFLLSGMSNPMLPERINAFRNKGNSNFNELRYLFNKMRLNVHPSFQASMEGDVRRKLSLSIISKMPIAEDIHQANQSGASSADGAKSETCIELDYEIKRGRSQRPIKYKSEFCVLPNGKFSPRASKNYQETLNARFISSYSETHVLSEELSTLVKMNKKDEVIRMARMFDPRITNIEILVDGIFVKYDDIDEMLPLAMCGEGFKKFLNIIVTVENGGNNVLLIDEIDNGVHFSAYHTLWKSLLELANRNGIQLFITTHSAEVIAAFVNVLQDSSTSKEIKDNSFIYTIANTSEQGMQSYRYNADDISQAIQNHIELRL